MLAPAKRATTFEIFCMTHARLKMTTHPKTQDLARCLLAYEAAAGKTSESATLLVYEKLRQGLAEFAGVAGFQSLAFRALALARAEDPSLSAVRVAPDGSIHGLGEVEHRADIDKDRAGVCPAGEGGVVLIARLLGLLLIFLGESLTLSLLRVKWPQVVLDDCSSENGRKA